MFGLHKKKESESVRDVGLEIAKSDTLKVVEILKNSLYQDSMQWKELLIRFKRMTGVPEDIAQERLIRAIELLKRSQGVGCAGVGSTVMFSRTIPLVVL